MVYSTLSTLTGPSLLRTLSWGAGMPTSPVANRSLRGLAAAVEQLAQDVADDAETYQAALPAACGLSLPAIAARHAALAFASPIIAAAFDRDTW